MGFEPTLMHPELTGDMLTNCATWIKVPVGRNIIIMYSEIYHCLLTQQQTLMTP